MKAYELSTKMTPESKLELPDALQKVLPRDEALQVLILAEDASQKGGETSWTWLTAEQFLSGYGESDTIYDRV